jgi:hypothetical protein
MVCCVDKYFFETVRKSLLVGITVQIFTPHKHKLKISLYVMLVYMNIFSDFICSVHVPFNRAHCGCLTY